MLRLYLIGLLLISFIALSCLVAILVYVDPGSANWMVFFLFYLSLFIAVTGVFASFGWLTKRLSRKKVSKSLSFRYLEISVRQGVLISLVLVCVLILQSKRVLEWWHILFLLSLIGAAEWWLSDN